MTTATAPARIPALPTGGGNGAAAVRAPGAWPEATTRDDFTNLLVLLRYAREGCWAFALYNQAAVREQVVEALTALLAPLPVYQWTYSPHDPFPYSYLARMPETARSERAVVFLFDFERAGEEIWKALDYNRELFSQHPHGLVFWVTPPGRGLAARQAPHFWAQRSGVFDFTIDRPLPVEQVRPLVGMGVSNDNLDETQRQLRLYQGLLEDLDGQPDAPLLFLGDLHLKVARLAYYVDQVPLARQHAQVALDIAVDQSAARLRADSIRALGDVHVQLSEYQEARARYEEAQGSYRAIGDRLGEANCYLGVADIDRCEESWAAAAGGYERALAYYRSAGMPFNIALALQRLGHTARGAGDPDRARQYFEEALAIFRRIGSPLANSVQNDLEGLRR